MTHAETLARLVAIAPDFTIAEETSDELGPSGKRRSVRIIIARCTFRCLPYERSETAGPGAEDRVLAICLRSLLERQADALPAHLKTWDTRARA